MSGSQHCSSQKQCFYRATLLVDIRIAKETEIQPSPGDNSQSISAISSGPQLKALSRSSEMIYCTWLYIIMALVIIYDSFLLFFFPFFSPAFSAGTPMEAMHCTVQIFSLCFPCSCQGSVQQNHCSSAAFWALGCQCPRRGICSTFPVHGHKAEQTFQGLFMATLEFLVSEWCKNI